MTDRQWNLFHRLSVSETRILFKRAPPRPWVIVKKTPIFCTVSDRQSHSACVFRSPTDDADVMTI